MKRMFPAASPTPAQTAAMSLRWFQSRSSSQQDGAGAGDLGGRAEAENLFAGLRVGERVGDSARGAGPSGVGDAFGERLSLGCPLEAAVLIEEPRVEMEDQVADDVEAEVAGFDDACVDRADRDLVGVVAAHRHRPGGEIEIVLDQRA